MLPAFTDVRAARLLANRMEVELPHQLLEPNVLRPAWSPDLQPGGLSIRQCLYAMPASDLIECLAH